MITYPTAAPRLTFGKAALGLIAAAAAALGFAGTASAAVISPAPGDTLSSAITTANTNSDASNIIVLADGRYTPSVPLPAITKTLTITSNHALQEPTSAGGPRIDCSTNPTSNADFMTINSGVSVTLEGFLMTTCANTTSFGTIRDKGTLTTWGMEISGNNGNGLNVDAGATATLNETGVHDGITTGIRNSGALTLNNSTVANNVQGGIVNVSATPVPTLTLNNSIVANNNPNLQTNTFDCSPKATAQDKSMDSDNSCGVSFPSQNPNFDFSSNTLGGPTPVLDIVSPSPAQGVGDPAKCPTTDARFFVHTSTTSCDIGYFWTDGSRQTTAPSCSVTNTNPSGTPPTQTVTVSDSRSGMGPEASTAYDPNSQTSPQPQNARASTPIPGDAISGLGITNGTVAISTLPTAPSTSPITLTASKTTLGTLTHWWFTATNWAGNVTFCQ